MIKCHLIEQRGEERRRQEGGQEGGERGRVVEEDKSGWAKVSGERGREKKKKREENVGGQETRKSINSL